MAEPFRGEIRLFSFNFAPKGWAPCNGQLLQINQNQALFALLGTYYGGDGRVTFALPNLQGRAPVHVGDTFVEGNGGAEPVALAVSQSHFTATFAAPPTRRHPRRLSETCSPTRPAAESQPTHKAARVSFHQVR